MTSSQARADRQDLARETPRPMAVSTLPPRFDEWQIELHGRRVIYRVAGSGPPVVLIHGMLNSSSHWRSVALNLASDYTVIAPDLIGHGDSAAPRGDYSLGAHAASIRDLLAAIGDRACEHRRSLARRGCGDAVLLPVPAARRASRADLQRRSRARGQPDAAHRRAARYLRSAFADHPPASARRAEQIPATACASARFVSAFTCRRSPERCARWRTPTPARRSCRHSAR